MVNDAKIGYFQFIKYSVYANQKLEIEYLFD